MVDSIRPIEAADRIASLDVLRGFALLGMLLVHFPGEIGTFLPVVDEMVRAGLVLFAEESFAPIFGFLFGLGFAIQLERARALGRSFVWIYVRRMSILLLIGAVHMVLLSDVDILVQYALTGLLLIPLQRLRASTLLALTVGLLVLQIGEDPIRRMVDRARGSSVEEIEAAAQRDADWIAEHEVEWARRGQPSAAAPTYRQDVMRRWDLFVTTVRERVDPRRIPFDGIFFLFVCGLFVGRMRWFEQAERHRGAFARTAVLGVVVSIVGLALMEAFENPPAALDALAFRMANLGPSLAYVAIITFLTTGGRAAGTRPLRVLAPVGRMALTNYLMQSLLVPWAFFPYGLALPEPSATGWLLLNLAFFFAVQVTFSHWWMSRYRLGPMEWVWRSLTLLEPQPMRRTPVERAVTP
jgi:uncharacterized protein